MLAFEKWSQHRGLSKFWREAPLFRNHASARVWIWIWTLRSRQTRNVGYHVDEHRRLYTCYSRIMHAKQQQTASQLSTSAVCFVLTLTTIITQHVIKQS